MTLLRNKTTLRLWQCLMPSKKILNLLRQVVEENKKYLNGIVLDAGCGCMRYKKYVKGKYIGLDIEKGPCPEDLSPDTIASIEDIPISDSSIDTILCIQVFEHIENPEKTVKEFYRILKPKGKVVLTASFVEGEHGGKYDHLRYTNRQLVRMFRRNRFRIIKSRKYGNLSLVLSAFLSYWLFKKWRNHMIILSPLIIIWNIINLFSNSIKDTNFYIFSLVVGEKMVDKKAAK